jgi:hypothetical protein
MGKKNNNLVSTKIKDTTKQKLELIKSIYRGLEGMEQYSKSDYATLEYMIEREYETALTQFNRMNEALQRAGK